MYSQEQLTQPEIDEKLSAANPGIAGRVSDESDFQIHVRVVDLLSSYTVPGVLLSFWPGEVAILVDERLSNDRDVAVHLSPFSFEGQTLSCRQHETQYEVHISIGDVEGAGLRRMARFPVMIPAEMLAPNGDPVAITIRDLSRDGMGIESPIPLEAGQPIAIVSRPAFVFAVVRYCREMSGGRFRAGVEMHHLFQRPAEPPEQSQQSSSAGKILRHWAAKLFSLLGSSHRGSRDAAGSTVSSFRRSPAS